MYDINRLSTFIRFCQQIVRIPKVKTSIKFANRNILKSPFGTTLQEAQHQYSIVSTEFLKASEKFTSITEITLYINKSALL